MGSQCRRGHLFQTLLSYPTSELHDNARRTGSRDGQKEKSQRSGVVSQKEKAETDKQTTKSKIQHDGQVDSFLVAEQSRPWCTDTHSNASQHVSGLPIWNAKDLYSHPPSTKQYRLLDVVVEQMDIGGCAEEGRDLDGNVWCHWLTYLSTTSQ
ncbi:hypothetical protein BDN67DRAFT_970889 [Paxillus ammoniavirescens]|nr:hypothetical protein BDN67DRAFT_970889 [Paxillus ammoniavirescens]